jgi:hypothetical protein
MEMIYALQHPVSMEIRYIGVTSKDIEFRLKEHIQEAKRGANSYRCKWIRSILNEGLIPKVICIDNIEDSNNRNYWEMFYIATYRYLGYRLTNGSDGGEGVKGYKFTPEVLQKMSRIQKAVQNTPENIKRNKEAQKIAQNRPEVKLKHSLASKGRKLTEEHKNKCSQSLKGHLTSEETKIKIGLGNKGKLYTKETKLKMRLSRLRKIPATKGSNKYINPNLARPLAKRQWELKKINKHLVANGSMCLVEV